MKEEPTKDPVVSASADAAVGESSVKPLDLLESSTSAAKKVTKLSDDESEGLAALDIPTSTVPAEAGPSAPRVSARPDTSCDKEFPRALFITLNREALGIPGDGGLVDLVSDEEDYGRPEAARKKVAWPQARRRRGRPRAAAGHCLRPPRLPVLHQVPEALDDDQLGQALSSFVPRARLVVHAGVVLLDGARFSRSVVSF